jgi:hypothetical protein
MHEYGALKVWKSAWEKEATVICGETSSRTTLSTPLSTWTKLGANPGLRGDKLTPKPADLWHDPVSWLQLGIKFVFAYDAHKFFSKRSRSDLSYIDGPRNIHGGGGGGPELRRRYSD